MPINDNRRKVGIAMWEVIGVLFTFAVLAAFGWALVYVIKQAQTGDRSNSDKDSGKYNDAG
jgi:hypothetical protein